MSKELVDRIESKIDNMLYAMETFPQHYKWCTEQFGPEGARWTARVTAETFPDACFEFSDDEDRLLFMLRWS